MFPDPTHQEVLHVVQHLRKSSHDEIFGASDATPEQFTENIAYSPGFKWVGYYDGNPAAIIGASPLHGGVWALFGFGTDDWANIWRPVTRMARRGMMQAVTDAGAHRAHCVTCSDHTDTHRWLRALGATLETPMPKYGKDGRDYTMFAWIRDDLNVR
jgi:hypothetical protein